MIIVFGSINMDLFVAADRLPQPGETMLCDGFEMSPGGKGANQALAALRSGAKVAMVGRMGDDGMGLRVVTGLRREGVITSGVVQSDKATGCAIILRDSDGGNRIIVAAGANAEATSDQVPDEILKPGNILLAQMETPAREVCDLLRRARAGGATTILNLAPVMKLEKSALAAVDYLVVNEIEATQLAALMNLGDTDLIRTAQAVSKAGNLTCIVTLGAKGAFAWTKEGRPVQVPALKIDETVDTTGAGDAYCGTLAAALHKGLSLEDAMRRASVAGSLSCQKKGAQESFPWLGDIEDRLSQL